MHLSNMKFQPQSSISLGSSGSHNSTFFKIGESNEVVYSISNMTEESGLLSALTRNEDIIEEKIDPTTIPCDSEMHRKTMNTGETENVNSYLSNTITFQRGRSSTSRYTNNSESFAQEETNSSDSITSQKVKNLSSSYEEFRAIFQKGTDCLKHRLAFHGGTEYSPPTDTKAFLLKPQDYYESAKEACHSRPCEGFKINLSNGIESLKSAANECGVWYSTSQGCSTSAFSAVDNIQKLEMQLIDCIEPDSMKENTEPIKDFGTLSPETKFLIEKTAEGKYTQNGDLKQESCFSPSMFLTNNKSDGDTLANPVNIDDSNLHNSMLVDPDNEIVQNPPFDDRISWNDENNSSADGEYENIEIDVIPSWIENDIQASIDNETENNTLAPKESEEGERLSDDLTNTLDSQPLCTKDEQKPRPKSRFSPANKLRQLAIQRKKRALARSLASRGYGNNWRKKIYEI